MLTRSDRVPFLHDYPAFRRDPIGFWTETGQLGPAVEVRFGPSQRFVVLSDPEIVEHVLLKEVKDHPRDRRVMSVNDSGGPERMFTTDRWEEWKWRRRLMQPAFHRKHIAGFESTIVTQAERIASEMAGSVVDLATEMRRMTMRMILETMFSLTSDQDVEDLQAAFEANAEYVFKRSSAPLAVPAWLPTPMAVAQRRSERARLGFLQDIVARRLATGPGSDDLLDMLITARLDDSDHQFSAEQLVAEMSGIVFAGHETTAVTMTWLFYLLDRHRAVLEKLTGEIRHAIGDRSPTVDVLERMPLVDSAVQEAMRLYPAVYVTVREADSAHTVGEFSYEAGTRFLINIRGMHRDPAAWDEPDEFRPSRFTEGHDRHRFQYIPFLAGPKKCLGDTFAMTEMRLAVPTILARLDLQAVDPVEVREAAGFTMKPAGPIMMRAKARLRD